MKKSVSKQTFFAAEELYPSLPCIPRLPWFQKLTLHSQVPVITNSNLLPLLICAEASNTLSLQKNTFKLRADQKQNPVNRSNPEILSKNQPTFPSQLLPFTIFTPKIISPKLLRRRKEKERAMKTPDLKLKNLKKTRIPGPSFRRVYTFFTYSPRTFAAPPNTFSLHKNTLTGLTSEDQRVTRVPARRTHAVFAFACSLRVRAQVIKSLNYDAALLEFAHSALESEEGGA